MADRPTVHDIALDAIDDAFKQAVIQFAKNAATGDTPEILLNGLKRVYASRQLMIKLVEGMKNG